MMTDVRDKLESLSIKLKGIGHLIATASDTTMQYGPTRDALGMVIDDIAGQLDEIRNSMD